MNERTDYGKALKELFPTYAGVFLYKDAGGWYVPSLKQLYPTWEDACYGIDKFFREWGEQTKKQNPRL